MAKKPKISKGLLDAIKFIYPVQKDKGNVFQTHCRFENNWLTATDGQTTIGHPIAEELSCCPHTTTLQKALTNCGQNISLTQLEGNRLSVKSGRLKVIIPCTAEELPETSPDAPQATITDELIQGLTLVAPLPSDDSPIVHNSAILLGPGSVTGTNGVVVIEYWHGIDLPPNLVIPVAAIKAVLKSGKKLKQLGFSNTSITFHFENGAWIKTQLYQEKFPDCNRILNQETNAEELPKDFFKAVNTLKDFGDYVFFFQDQIRTSKKENEGANFELSGLTLGAAFAIKQLRLIENCCLFADYKTHKNMMFFFGGRTRGAILQVRG
jgi:hypothetical protein